MATSDDRRAETPAEVRRVDGPGGTPVLAVAGEIDVATSPELRDELYRAIDEGAPKVVVDLAELDFIDSSGLGVLVAALKHVRERGGDLELHAVPPAAQRVFEITGLTELFTIR